MELDRLRRSERWIAWVRVAAVVFAVLEVGLLTERYPPGYETAAWIATAVFAVGAAAILAATRLSSPRVVVPLGAAALIFDALLIATFATIYSYEYGSPTRWGLIFVVVEGALRYGLIGGILVPLALAPYLWFAEHWRATRFGPPGFIADRFTFPTGVLLLTGAIVGLLVGRLRSESATADLRAHEAEALRDQLGRRADALEAANRCARALSSSLDLDQAFGAFIRELRGLLPFDRMAIVLGGETDGRVMAVAGVGSGAVFPQGSRQSLEGTLHAEVLRELQTRYRPRIDSGDFREEGSLAGLGLSARVVAPLLAGAKPVGTIGLLRREPDSFTAEEIELAGLLGRLVGSAVENIRAYETERRTVEELTTISTLRTDFVSLVSHELRSPVAAVRGAAQTLRDRGHELSAEDRGAMMAVIEQESDRLATLVRDVFDASLIEGGTFPYEFSEIDVAAIVRESTAAAGAAPVDVHTIVPPALPTIRGDRERLRQVLANLIDNAIKYSPPDAAVDVSAYLEDGSILVDVRDRGPGIDPADQVRIFEKFGRSAASASSKPGTGLGLFIARSIAEAHGGSLEVESSANSGSTFTLSLPVERG